MKKSSQPYWKGIVIGALIPSITDIFGWTSIWSFVWNKVILCFINKVLLFKFLMPIWILVLIAFLFIFLIYLGWRKSFRRYFYHHISSIYDYTTDEFHGIKYVWRWGRVFGGRKGIEISEYDVLCPVCDCVLVNKVHCPNCNKDFNISYLPLRELDALATYTYDHIKRK